MRLGHMGTLALRLPYGLPSDRQRRSTLYVGTGQAWVLLATLVMALHCSRWRRKKCVETFLNDGVAFA